MFSMTIVFGESPVPWTLLFKTKAAFDQAQTTFNISPTAQSFTPALMLEIIDDFGQHVVVARDKIQGVMFEDLEQSKLAHIERGLHQTRTQIAAENAGRADPAISGAMRARTQGPPVITPFNGAFRQ